MKGDISFIILVSTYTYRLAWTSITRNAHAEIQKKKNSYPHPIPPFFRCPRNMGPSNWLGGSFRLNGQPHLSTSTTPKPTDDLFPLPDHKPFPFPLLTFNRRQSSTFFHTCTFCHQRKCRLTVFLHTITLPPNSAECSVRYS
jgi:hypothetical protein